MKEFVYLLLFTLLISACEKTIDTNYQIKINGVSSSIVRIDDTISVYINWLNSDKTGEIKMNIDGIMTDIISVDDTIINIKIPSGWEKGELKITHSNGAEDTWWGGLEKQIYPIVYSVSNLTGIAGDKITLKGIDFLSPPRINVKINTQDCDINSMTDSTIIFTVPEFCGNGQIQIQYWETASNYCIPDIEKNCGLFQYQFKSLNNKRIIEEYTYLGLHYELHRDSENRVIKRIITEPVYNSYKNTFDVITYNSNGYVDSIKFFNDSLLESYRIFERNNNNTQIEVSTFDSDNNFRSKEEYHYINERVAQINIHVKSEETIYIRESLQYDYKGDFASCVRKIFESNGSVSYESTTIIKYDIYNNTLPELGLPGYVELGFDKYPVIAEGYATYKTFYDEYGDLMRVEHYHSCDFEKTEYSFTYKEQ
jgi:hypothetical protein